MNPGSGIGAGGLRVEELRVELPASDDDIVDGISFEVRPGQVLGLVGESGSGKTTVANALLGSARGGARIVAGRVLIEEENLLELSPSQLRRRRGRLITYVPQDPSSALNPALRLRRQLDELIETHGAPTGQSSEERNREVLGEVKLPSDAEFLARYPHQLSGGQQQRFCIAMAFVLRPRVIVLDEPTTGLDVTTQAHVLATARELCARHGVAAVYVSHDLSVVAELADRVLVLYGGRGIEIGNGKQVFGGSGHVYTTSLVGAIPDVSERRALDSLPGHVPAPGSRPEGCVFAPRCPLRISRCTEEPPGPVELEPGHTAYCYRAGEATRGEGRLPGRAPALGAGILDLEGIEAGYGDRRVLHGISMSVAEGECLAVVGESGSGKTTLSRAAVGLLAPDAGQVRFRGEVLAPLARDRSSAARRQLQFIFQSPYTSLNPRRTIGQIIATPLRHFFSARGREADGKVIEALERVSLPEEMMELYPDQLSGGERQRVAIARALVCEPEVLVCDEITSALDVSVQSAIVELLGILRRDGLSVVFVTHNLALVRTIADRVLVMREGVVVERGEVESLLTEPEHPYTQRLLADTPSLPSVALN